MKDLRRRQLTPKRAAIVAGVAALLIGVYAGAREYDLNDSFARSCATIPSFCLGDGNNALVATLKFAALASVVYFLIIFGALMIARFVWRTIIARRRAPAHSA